jgi:DNA-binding LacI/PurR family transcriptional regulator
MAAGLVASGGVARRATLQTIADAVGVSRATVSNAYNRPDQLGAELRERIMDAARELGYPGPDPAARSLRRGQAGAVGLLFTETLSYAFSDAAAVAFLEGLARRCEEAGAALLLLPLPASGAGGGEAVREAVVDALCIYSMPHHHPAVDAVLERRLPTVIVDEPYLEGTTFVGIEDRRGARLIGEHLTGLGHRRVAAIVPSLVPDRRHGLATPERLRDAAYDVDRQRLAGLREALEEVGVSWEDLAIYECDNREEGGLEAGEHLLRRDPRPTALFATTDVLALGALRAARELGLSVPGDVSITGFDDIPEAARAEPPLTTVRQPLVEKGIAAGRLLLGLMEGGETREETLPVELVTRGSTGPIR